MNAYLKITARTFTIWILTSLINGLFSGICLSIINTYYETIIAESILIFVISLFFSAPGFFIFWLVLLYKIAVYITERALFRSALVTGFILAAATAYLGKSLYRSEFNNHSFIPAACIILSALISIMLHFKQFQKIKLTDLMTKSNIPLFLILSGAFLFNIFFWKEKLGINAILFDAFICISVCYLFPYSLKSGIAKWLLAGHIIAAGMVIIQNTTLSEISFFVTLLLFISFSQYLHRSALYAGGSVFLNYIFVIPNLMSEFKKNNNKKIRLPLLRLVRIFIIPVLIAAVFAFIYSSANNIFLNIINDFLTVITNWLTHFFAWFAFERIAFFLLGVLIVGGLILQNKLNYFSERDMKKQNGLSRKRGRLKKWKESAWSELLIVIAGKASTGIMALKNELTIGSVCLVLLNILLLIINVIDIKYVWLGVSFNNDAAVAAYVHEGAWLLILSIVLAMLLLLFFFRGNLNFYRKNRWLRYSAYIWIIQNGFLVFSVFNRDYFYILHLGLAYKRIGLLFYLAMVLAGLFTVFLKIYFAKTTYFLLRINAWVAVVLLIFAATVNWDFFIAKYNISNKSSVKPDVAFLLSLSDTALPLFEENKDILENDIASGNKYFLDGEFKNAVEFFESRKKDFMQKQKKYSWLSWNLADENVKQELFSQDHFSILK